MCTAIVFGNKNRYFGRNLDYEVSFGERVVITPRNFKLDFRYLPNMSRHAAFIGMATVVDGYPLYYDATNEYGLSVAGLNFVGNCHFYSTPLDSHENLCQFELIPYIMAKCSTVKDARAVFERLNVLGEAFSPELPIAQLHWMIADKHECCTLEITRCGVNVYCNDALVLTNNPPFSFHTHNLNLYRSLTCEDAEARFGSDIPFDMFSRGMGAIGLPGDWSSPSRFVRAAFVRSNAVCCSSDLDRSRRDANVTQFFRVLDSVAMVKGCVKVGDDYEYTMYSSCCDTEQGIYYFKTYDESIIRRVDMGENDLDSDELIQSFLSECKVDL